LLFEILPGSNACRKPGKAFTKPVKAFIVQGRLIYMIIIFTSALIAYFISTIIGSAEVFRGKRETSKTMTIFAVIGFVMHTASLIVSISTYSHVPITTLQEAASFFAWSVVLLFFMVEYKYRSGLLGSFVMPVASVLMLSSSMLPDETIPLKPGVQSCWHGLHTIFAFMGGSVFAAACSVGIMFIIQEHL
jgi:ABC-type transport system involved in cytochrome c biogenesis permease subunit